MAPRANWKGFLRLSLVTCPIALFPATSESEKISFNQINKKTGHRIRYLKVDADTGEEVSNDDIIKGYQVDKDRYLEVTKDELENIALESTRTIEIDEFVPRSEIDDLYLVRPYYIVPDGKVGHDAFAVIRETIRSLDKVALARVVLTNREHVIALEARDKGLMGTLLAILTRCATPRNISTIFRTSRLRRTCWTWRNTSSSISQAILSQKSSRITTRPRWPSCSPRNRRACRSRQRRRRRLTMSST
jgi:Ku protein